jgi:hypothetical protein
MRLRLRMRKEDREMKLESPASPSGLRYGQDKCVPKQMRLSRFSGYKVGKLGIGLMGLLFEVHR